MAAWRLRRPQYQPSSPLIPRPKRIHPKMDSIYLHDPASFRPSAAGRFKIWLDSARQQPKPHKPKKQSILRKVCICAQASRNLERKNRDDGPGDVGASQNGDTLGTLGISGDYEGILEVTLRLLLHSIPCLETGLL